jgi:N-acetylneuraminate synthase
MSSIIIERAMRGQFVLIAEIGVNYYDIAKKGNLSIVDAAKYMIAEAKRAGAHAVKFQTYKAEELAIRNSPSYWDLSKEATKSQFLLFKRYDLLGYDQYRNLRDYCKDENIEFLSTPFDFDSVDYLYDLMQIYKISSSDLNNLPFISYIAKKGKPIILSVGASNEEEIDASLSEIRKYNSQPLVIMHCVLEYPTPYEHASLNKIISLKKKYNNEIIGYSDHTEPDLCYDVIKSAYNLGAIVIEKHFTLDKNLLGNDHYHAMDANDVRNIIKSINYLDLIRGKGELVCLESEKTARLNARRSIVSNGIIPKGATIEFGNIKYKRPGVGIAPCRVNEIIGKKVKFDIKSDEILQFDMLCD